MPYGHIITYAAMAMDPRNGNAVDLTFYWSAWERLGAHYLPKSSAGGLLEDLPIIDDKITLHEVLLTIEHMKYHKTPGEDGIPAEFLHLAARKGDSNFGATLVALMQRVFETGVIPEEWLKSTVVAIPKPGGDPIIMSDNRGISLMTTILKLLVGLLGRRIYVALEKSDLLFEGQGGFRDNEECILQVAALHDIVKRRRAANLETYLVFVDFKAAYDTVPHRELFRKMHHYGVRGKTLRFFKNLYKGSTFRVLSSQGTLSKLYALLRGLRQGCPASPALFNLFINDIFWSRRGTAMGVKVPIERESPWDPNFIKVTGLLFADDLVGLCGDLRQVRHMCAHLGSWAAANGMTFGIRKCGIMATSDLGHNC